MLFCIQVIRYTALLSGVFYGISHRRSLQKAHDADKEHHAIHEREHLVAQAKEAWKRKNEGSMDGGEHCPLAARIVLLLLRCATLLTTWQLGSVVTDPEDPRFDLEKLIAKWESDS